MRKHLIRAALFLLLGGALAGPVVSQVYAEDHGGSAKDAAKEAASQSTTVAPATAHLWQNGTSASEN